MSMHTISREIIKAFKNGNKLLICGNGGSATMASHFAGEFVGKFEKDRQALPAISLTDSTAVITAVANDFSYKEVFSRQIEALGRPGDILVTLSTSGTSENIIRAIGYAKIKGLKVYSFPTKGNISTAECQELHLKLVHRISREVENEFS